MYQVRINIFIEVVLFGFLFFILFPIKAHADMGPKPSIVIQLDNLDDKTCYGTLLSPTEHVAFYHKWDGDENQIEDPFDNLEIWRKFVEYQDADGYNFLQLGRKCSGETKYFSWNYMPPHKFKVLLYFEDTDTFYVSDIQDRYAFDSVYTVDINKLSEGSTVAVKPSYDYIGEIRNLIIRVILTVLIELFIAWLFVIRDKKAIAIITVTNVVTQLLLNILLNICTYKYGLGLMFVFNYIILEIIIFIIEAIIYNKILRKKCENRYSAVRVVIYALVANFVSYQVGLYLSVILSTTKFF